jgi:hypothetical protein
MTKVNAELMIVIEQQHHISSPFYVVLSMWEGLFMENHSEHISVYLPAVSTPYMLRRYCKLLCDVPIKLPQLSGQEGDSFVWHLFVVQCSTEETRDGLLALLHSRLVDHSLSFDHRAFLVGSDCTYFACNTCWICAGLDFLLIYTSYWW